MEKDKIPVITINREYGAGGRSLASILSERLGIPYYDRDFVNMTADESGYDVEDVLREGEEISMSEKAINTMLKGIVSYTSSHDAIFDAEKKLVLDLAKSPCIMVGRCANYILDQAGIDNISIYLHAPFEHRFKRALEINENGDVKLEKYIEKRDKLRQIYYKKYTGNDIGDAVLYTFTFDTSKVSIDTCAKMVTDMIENKLDRS